MVDTTESEAEKGYSEARQSARNIKNFATEESSRLESEVNADRIIMIARMLKQHFDRLEEVKEIAGIVAYAKAHRADTDYDIVAMYGSLQSDLSAVITNIKSTFPTTADGYPKIFKFDADFKPVFDTFSPTQTTSLRTLLTTLAGGIS